MRVTSDLLDRRLLPARKALEIAEGLRVVVVRVPQREVCEVRAERIAAEHLRPLVVARIDSDLDPVALERTHELLQEVAVLLVVLSEATPSRGVLLYIDPVVLREGADFVDESGDLILWGDFAHATVCVCGELDMDINKICLNELGHKCIREEIGVVLEALSNSVLEGLHSILVNNTDRTVAAHDHVGVALVLNGGRGGC